MTHTLTSGDLAPDFSLADEQGIIRSLADYKGKKLLLFFYPRASTPGCTQQSCAVRDAVPQLSSLGVEVLGVSPDAASAQKKFAAHYSFGFPLLCDTEKSMATAWGVWGEKSLYGKKYMGIIRSAFLVDEAGILTVALYKIAPQKTVPGILKALQAKGS